MAENDESSFSENLSGLKDQAAEKLNELKGKAGELADDFQSGKLKEEAEEKLNDLGNAAKGLWNKITGQ